MQGWDDEYSQRFAQIEETETDKGFSVPIFLMVFSLILVLAGAAVCLVLYLRGDGEEPDARGNEATSAVRLSSAPVATTEKEGETSATATEEDAEPSEAATTEPRREYSAYRSANSVTTEGFAANVFAAFREAYEETGSTRQSLIVYSPSTRLDYRMTCSGEATVTCRGGRNAVVEIW